ncbi:MAG: GAF domain-containing protein [Gammaproteobacteria bacterium]
MIFNFNKIELNIDKKGFYKTLEAQMMALLEGESDAVANAANLSALLFNSLPDLNWVGFYFLRGDTLVVGPFQGKPACVRIPMGRGVCGTAAVKRETQVVDDVNAFSDHIACDADSRSEIVVPLIRNDAVLGVLDLDAPITHRFDDDDRTGLERIAALWIASLSD